MASWLLQFLTSVPSILQVPESLLRFENLYRHIFKVNDWKQHNELEIFHNKLGICLVHYSDFSFIVSPAHGCICKQTRVEFEQTKIFKLIKYKIKMAYSVQIE